MWDPYQSSGARFTKKYDTWPAGWVTRKAIDSDKWVRRWYEVNRHVLYSYMQCPPESQQPPRIAAALDLRTVQKIAVVGKGLFVIVPRSAHGRHPGYLMKPGHPKSAEEWVRELNLVRRFGGDRWTRRGAHIVLRALVEKHPAARAPEGGCICGLLSRRRDAVSAFLYEVAPDGPFRNIVSFL